MSTTAEDKKRGQVVAYLRVSSDNQNLDRQFQLRDGADKVFEEKQSGAKRDRPMLKEMLSYVREGDCVRVWSMDRLARSLKDLDAIVEELKAKGVQVEFVTEKLTFDPSSDGQQDPMKRLLFQILGSFAEFERSILKARQAEGIAKAKAQGKYVGRKRALTDEQLAEAKAQVDLGVPKAQVARDFGLSRQALHRYLADSSRD